MLAYLFSRFPVVSQTFCDTEMLALEAAGHQLVVGSLNPPSTSFRHERLAHLQAEVIYPPPAAILDLPLTDPPDHPVWQAMVTLADTHLSKYGGSYKSHLRARNAWHFAREFQKRGVHHIHIHFANRATHTALFLKKAGFTYSFTAHAQDFMVDLANDDLLREMIREATFTAAVSDYSRALLTKICPDAADRIYRVYNGIDPTRFPKSGPTTSPPSLTNALVNPLDPQPSSHTLAEPLRLISIGRLIDFKGFPILLDALALLRDNQIPASLQIIGEGPQRPALEAQIDRLQLQPIVHLRGILSQEEIKRELAASDVFTLACLTDEKGATDILPTVILEAMACALPVVSTTLAGVPEMVLHGITGLLAPPHDASALAAHFTTLARAPALRRQLGQAGLQHVQETFSLQKTAGHLASLFSPKVSVPLVLPVSSVLCLLDAPTPPDLALLHELTFLSTHPQISLLTTRQTLPFQSLPTTNHQQTLSQLPTLSSQQLPDATVLEATWRAHPILVARCESLRSEAGRIDGELYYLNARRAVHLASQLRHHPWTRLHALRANTVLLTWLLHRLTDLPASATIEATHLENRAALTKLLPAFTHGSNSDPKLKTAFPDLLQLAAPPAPKRLFGFKLPKASTTLIDIASIWTAWLSLPARD